MREYHFFVYILASRSRTLYIGVTNNLVHRVLQHREKKIAGFTSRYNVTRLVHYERYQYVNLAIQREKELKDWRRELKVELIETHNPAWVDLAAGWVRDMPDPQYDWGLENGMAQRRKADPSAALRDDKVETNKADR